MNSLFARAINWKDLVMDEPPVKRGFNSASQMLLVVWSIKRSNAICPRHLFLRINIAALIGPCYKLNALKFDLTAAHVGGRDTPVVGHWNSASDAA